MDKVKEYKAIVRALVEEIGKLGSSSFEEIETYKQILSWGFTPPSCASNWSRRQRERGIYVT